MNASLRIALIAGSPLALLASVFSPTARADTIFGLTVNNSLLSFDSAAPLITSTPVAISGLQSGESMLGIDFRPATGGLYGLGSSGRLYLLDPASGAASQVGSGTFAVPLNGTSFGFDFNPTVDRIRVTSNAGQNLRLNPLTGGVVDFDPVTPGVQPDGSLAYASGDPGFGVAPGVVASAYTNNFNGATSTVLYNLDITRDMLVIQGSPPSAMPVVSPNLGVLNSVGPLGVDSANWVGFDIASSNGAAFGALDIAGFPTSSLYSINLATGSATFLSAIDADPLTDIAIAVPSAPAATLGVLAMLTGLRRRRRVV